MCNLCIIQHHAKGIFCRTALENREVALRIAQEVCSNGELTCTSHVYHKYILVSKNSTSEIQPMELATEPRDMAEHVFRDRSQPS